MAYIHTYNHTYIHTLIHISNIINLVKFLYNIINSDTNVLVKIEGIS